MNVDASQPQHNPFPTGKILTPILADSGIAGDELLPQREILSLGWEKSIVRPQNGTAAALYTENCKCWEL
jgi:hypothetical protein